MGDTLIPFVCERGEPYCAHTERWNATAVPAQGRLEGLQVNAGDATCPGCGGTATALPGEAGLAPETVVYLVGDAA